VGSITENITIARKVTTWIDDVKQWKKKKYNEVERLT